MEDPRLNLMLPIGPEEEVRLLEQARLAVQWVPLVAFCEECEV